MAARVTIGGSELDKSTVAHVEVGQNGVCACGCVQRSVEIGLLGFSCGRPWGTSMWLVLLGEGLMCTNLRSHSLLGCWILTQHRAIVVARCREV